MSKKRINAYTLMEVTVAMLLAAVCISICYTAYGLIGNYFREFQSRNAVTQDILLLNRALDHDFANARYLVRTDDGIRVESSAQQISYVFSTDAVLRKVVYLRTDSFKFRAVDVSFVFMNREANVMDTVDQVSFSLDLQGSGKIPVTKWKRYSAQDLLR